MIRQALVWFFRNRQTGAITIAQAPNLLLWTALVAFGIRALVGPTGRVGLAVAIVAKGAIILWAIDEILRGVNPWRRCLGAGVLLFAIITLPIAGTA